MESNQNDPVLIREDMIVFDFETTGLSPRKGSQIVEIGAVKINANGSSRDVFETFVKPTVRIDPGASKVNGITDEMVENAPHRYDAFQQFIKWVGSARLWWAYNAGFEFGFIESLMKDDGLWESGKMNGLDLDKFVILDLYELVEYKERNSKLVNKKLVTVSGARHVYNVGLHRALDDALASANLLGSYFREMNIMSYPASTPVFRVFEKQLFKYWRLRGVRRQ